MGEELGLPEVLDLPDDRRQDPIFLRSRGSQLGRDGCRVPIPWTHDAQHSFGFSQLDTPTWLPQPNDWGRYSVERQTQDPDSMLSLYRRALATRSMFVAQGDDLLIEREGDVLVLRRGRAVAVVNFGADPSTITGLGPQGGLRTLVVSHPEALRTDGVIAGNSAAWLYPA
jgi:alpha-glucosidase